MPDRARTMSFPVYTNIRHHPLTCLSSEEGPTGAFIILLYSSSFFAMSCGFSGSGRRAIWAAAKAADDAGGRPAKRLAADVDRPGGRPGKCVHQMFMFFFHKKIHIWLYKHRHHSNTSIVKYVHSSVYSFIVYIACIVHTYIVYSQLYILSTQQFSLDFSLNSEEYFLM